MDVDRVFICPGCGYRAAYQPEECSLFTVYRAGCGKVNPFPVRLVYCPRCGEGHEVPEAPEPKT